MRFMMLVCTDPSAEPYVEAEDNYAVWDSSLEARGILLHKQRLRPVEQATLVRVRGGKVLVTDGPFAETKETIAGFVILEVSSRDEAIQLASEHAMARFGTLELREFWSFGDAPEIPKGQGDEADGYMLLICNDPDAEAYRPELDNIQEWGAEVAASGKWTQGDRLRPSDQAITVRRRNGRLLVTNGPFAETKETLAGYDLLRCAHLDEAIAIAARHPMARFGRVEIRPFWPR